MTEKRETETKVAIGGESRGSRKREGVGVSCVW